MTLEDVIEERVQRAVDRAVAPLVAEVRELSRAARGRRRTPDELAAELGVSTRTIRRHIRSGRLRAVRVGRTTLVEPPDAVGAAEVAHLAAEARGG